MLARLRGQAGRGRDRGQLERRLRRTSWRRRAASSSRPRAPAQERNEVRFGHWFAQAFAGGAADIDKDGALSLFEAYAYTVREVKREYESDNKLQTEHARITDSTLARQFVFGVRR